MPMYFITNSKGLIVGSGWSPKDPKALRKAKLKYAELMKKMFDEVQSKIEMKKKKK